MSASQKCKLSHCESLITPTATPQPIDWSLCALCQEPSDKPLVCPAKSKRTDIRAGYATLGHNLNSFRSVGNQPLPIDINMLDEGDDISNTIKCNHAKWHTSCRLKCSASRFARIELTTAVTSDASGVHPYMR